MLDRFKLIVELQKIAPSLFIDTHSSYDLIQKAWQALSNDPTFFLKVQQCTDAPWPIPLWKDNLAHTIPVETYTNAHIVFSVDGSQIYPDRHNSLPCFLINTGIVILPYNGAQSTVQLLSEPTVFAGNDNDQALLTIDGINCKRQELELAAGLKIGKEIKKNNPTTQSILLFDGSLIFWHLSSKEPEIRNYFLYSYLQLLDEFYHEKILQCWYISMPKSKELINLVRLYLCNFDHTKKELYEPINSVIDSTIMHTVLKPQYRSIVLSNHSSISTYYPSHLRPFFFYLNTGNEIGRVEIPAWIAHDDSLVSIVAQIVIDQCIKGGGYPVALAEAHEQAVVKGADREFFYHFLQKMGMERNYKHAISRKSLKKRGMGI